MNKLAWAGVDGGGEQSVDGSGGAVISAGARGRWNRVLTDLPWFFLVLAALPFHRESVICVSVVVVMAIAFSIRYYPREWLLFGVGAGLGLVFELGGDAIYKLQSWSEGSLFGIPAWLPLFWGLGFVFIRRFGNAVLSVREKA